MPYVPKSLFINESSLVLLIGVSGSGKSTFTKKHFQESEVLSTDFFRKMIADCEVDMEANQAAYALMEHAAAARMKHGKITVIDATCVTQEFRKRYLSLANEAGFDPIAVIFNLPFQECLERDKLRTVRTVGETVLRRQRTDLDKTLTTIQEEGFTHIIQLNSQREANDFALQRDPLKNRQKHPNVPYDIIGNIHNSLSNLIAILQSLGYTVSQEQQGYHLHHPHGRKVVFVGDVLKQAMHSPELQQFISDISGTHHVLQETYRSKV